MPNTWSTICRYGERQTSRGSTAGSIVGDGEVSYAGGGVRRDREVCPQPGLVVHSRRLHRDSLPPVHSSGIIEEFLSSKDDFQILQPAAVCRVDALQDRWGIIDGEGQRLRGYGIRTNNIADREV